MHAYGKSFVQAGETLIVDDLLEALEAKFPPRRRNAAFALRVAIPHLSGRLDDVGKVRCSTSVLVNGV